MTHTTDTAEGFRAALAAKVTRSEITTSLALCLDVLYERSVRTLAAAARKLGMPPAVVAGIQAEQGPFTLRWAQDLSNDAPGQLIGEHLSHGEVFAWMAEHEGSGGIDIVDETDGSAACLLLFCWPCECPRCVRRPAVGLTTRAKGHLNVGDVDRSAVAVVGEEGESGAPARTQRGAWEMRQDGAGQRTYTRARCCITVSPDRKQVRLSDPGSTTDHTSLEAAKRAARKSIARGW
jgi:hypothetical protein